LCELYEDADLKAKIDSVLSLKNPIAAAVYHKPPISADELYSTLVEWREWARPYLCNTLEYLHQALKDGKTILLEGQLGSLKDPDHGIYPFTTSSHTTAGFAAVGAGIPPYAIKTITTVVKAYSSAVGAGAFVSEIFGEAADELRRRGGDGGEFGATTGRPRRMGWFDCVATRYGLLVQGATEVAFTVVDVLGYLDEIPVCTAYEVDGEVTNVFPVTPKLNRAKPVLQVLPGWKTDIRGIKSYAELPENCRKYIEFIEAKIEVPISLVSNGPDREHLLKKE
jgi:adenylosuccinate synthase